MFHEIFDRLADVNVKAIYLGIQNIILLFEVIFSPSQHIIHTLDEG